MGKSTIAEPTSDISTLVGHLANGSIKSKALTQGFLDRISDTDEYLGAWQFVDTDGAYSASTRCG